MLFLLLSGQRCQTLHLICLDDIIFEDNSVIITTPHLLKNSKPGRHQSSFTFHNYTPNATLCIVLTWREYVNRTKGLRTTDQLMISTIKLHGAVSKLTLGGWIKLIILKAGIHTSFKPHSTRASTTPMANLREVPMQQIVKTAGWTNARTFAKYYNKPITDQCNSSLNDIM